MKKYFLAFVLFLILVSCDLYKDYSYTYDWDFPEEVSSEEDIYNILNRPEYAYRYDRPGQDVWNFPDETYYDTNYGLDCEDMAIFAMFLYKTCLGVDDVQIVGLQDKWDTDSYHMIYKVNGVYYQSTGWYKGKVLGTFLVTFTYNIIGVWSYSEAIQEIYKRR